MQQDKTINNLYKYRCHLDREVQETCLQVAYETTIRHAYGGELAEIRLQISLLYIFYLLGQDVRYDTTIACY